MVIGKRRMSVIRKLASANAVLFGVVAAIEHLSGYPDFFVVILCWVGIVVNSCAASGFRWWPRSRRGEQRGFEVIVEEKHNSEQDEVKHRP